MDINCVLCIWYLCACLNCQLNTWWKVLSVMESKSRLIHVCKFQMIYKYTSKCRYFKTLNVLSVELLDHKGRFELFKLHFYFPWICSFLILRVFHDTLWWRKYNQCYSSFSPLFSYHSTVCCIKLFA